MIKQKTKDYLIKNLEVQKNVVFGGSALQSLDAMIKEIKSLEVEPPCLFKKGEFILGWNCGSKSKTVDTFKQMFDGTFMCTNGNLYDNCAHFTEWFPYTGSKPELPDGARGWHIKLGDGQLLSLNALTECTWDNSKRDTKIIEFQYWMVRS